MYRKKKTESKILSIIVPVYNAENHIEYTIESILNQNIKCFELILVGNGNTDNSLQIMNQYNSYSNVKTFKQKIRNQLLLEIMDYNMFLENMYFLDYNDILNSNVLSP